MDTVTTIAQLIESSIHETRSLNWLSATGIPDSQFNREVTTTKISLPRMSGHTTAAIRVLSGHPTAIMIVDRTEKSSAIALSPTSKGIITMSELRDSSGLRTALKLQGDPELVIVDDVVHSDEDRALIFRILNPLCLVLLGNRSCR